MTGMPVTVVKNDYTGREVWRYEGRILKRGSSYVVLEATFNRNDRDLGYVTFRRGDRFVEYFYSDRWYNIFTLHDVTSHHLKGWYCNITRPAILTDGLVRADDLALDLFVYPDGRLLVLDRDEFEALPLTQVEHKAALESLATLMQRVARREPPFGGIKNPE